MDSVRTTVYYLLDMAYQMKNTDWKMTSKESAYAENEIITLEMRGPCLQVTHTGYTPIK